MQENKVLKISSQTRDLKDYKEAVVSWNFNQESNILVAGCDNGMVYVTKFSSDLLEELETAFQFDEEATDKLAIISLEFDLELIGDTLTCVLCDYAGTVKMLQIDVNSLQVRVDVLPFNCVINRSILTPSYIILVGAPLLVIERGVDVLLLGASPEDLSFERTIKVGQLHPIYSSYLYVSSHEGKVILLDITNGQVTTVKGVYADAFRIYTPNKTSYFIASNNVAHTISIYKISSNLVDLQLVDVIATTKKDMKSEFPYPQIYVDSRITSLMPLLAWFSTTPSVLTVVDENLHRTNIDIGDSLHALRIGNSLLIDVTGSRAGNVYGTSPVQQSTKSIKKSDTCNLEVLCYSSHLKVLPNVLKSNIESKTLSLPPLIDGQARLKLSSSTFADNGFIPKTYTCEGTSSNPDLSWINVPENTQSLAIILEDPDAIHGKFVHWLIYNIPANQTSLEVNLPKTSVFPNGVRQGINGANDVGYTGLCPPNEGKIHHYIFTIYALDTKISRDGLNKDELLKEMQGHILEQGQLTGLYRKGGF